MGMVTIHSPGGVAAHRGLDDLQDIVDGSRGGEGWPAELEALAVHVGMAVEEPGHGEAAAEVHPAGVGTDEARDLAVGAQRGDAPAPDAER